MQNVRGRGSEEGESVSWGFSAVFASVDVRVDVDVGDVAVENGTSGGD